jgi:hypothetical protein
MKPANTPANSLVAVPTPSGREQTAIRGANSPANGSGHDPLGGSLADAVREIDGQENVTDRPCPVDEIRIEPGYLLAGPTRYALGGKGVRRLCRLFSAPAEYIEKLNPELQALVLQHHLDRGDYRRSRLTKDNSVVLSRGADFVNLVRGDLLTLSGGEVLRAVQEGAGSLIPSLRVRSLAFGEESFQIEMLTEQIAVEARRDDLLHGGIRLKHSWLGEFATSIEAYAFRLVCANGLVRMECVRRRSARSVPRTRRLDRSQENARALQYEQVQRMAEDVFTHLEEKLQSVRRLQDQPFDLDNLGRFLQQARMHSEPMRGRLEAAWREEGSDASAFGALNTLTRLATHATDLSARQRTDLERLAGMFAGHGSSPRICPHCMSVLRA